MKKFLSRSEIVLPEILIKDFLLIDDRSDDRITEYAVNALIALLNLAANSSLNYI